jgi:RNA polymerase sigma factor (sigma-70 family)
MAPPPTPEETELVRWYREEVAVHENALRAYLLRAFRSTTDVEDVIRDTFARVLEARKAGKIRTTKAYLFAAARNAAIDALRCSKIVRVDSLAEIEELPVMDDRPSVPDSVGLRLNLEVLTQAVQSLPPRCREILKLRKLQGLSQKEIAAKLGISEHTVEAQISIGMHRCTQFLRERGLLDPKERP